jgi:hypothetical protein
VSPHQRDYFAELYIAGLMGDNGWSVYFPKRDVGFDFIATKTVFIATKTVVSGVLIRPVQVKGLYASEAKKDKTGYGYIGMLSQLHDDMALVLRISQLIVQALHLSVLHLCHGRKFAYRRGVVISVFPPSFLAVGPNHEKRSEGSLTLTVCGTWIYPKLSPCRRRRPRISRPRPCYRKAEDSPRQRVLSSACAAHH